MSAHLDRIMEKQNRIARVQVVFVDIEKYSRRRTVNQIAVIDSFTATLSLAIKHISQQYIEYAQNSSLNFNTDIITIPTGDGAAVIFPFEGLHDIHREFALKFLELTSDVNSENACERFNLSGWCNCHDSFNLTIGISEGNVVVFKDVNDNYNVAGSVVNQAARVMGKADRNQILFTDTAYEQLVELDEDVFLVDKFLKFDVEVKHDEVMSVHQLRDDSVPFLNSAPPEQLELDARMDSVIKSLDSIGLPFPQLSTVAGPGGRKQAVEMMENMAAAMSMMSEITSQVEAGPSVIDVEGPGRSKA